MKKFLLNTFAFILLLLSVYGIIFILVPPKNYGAAYIRVASPQYYSLIIGSSVSARGLSPSVMQQSLGDIYAFPMINFSFDLGTSPYGELYFSRISEKLKPNKNKNSLFIISVEPYTIADFETDRGNDKREYRGILSEINNVTSKPNWGYLFKHVFFTKNFVTFDFDNNQSGCDSYGFDASDLNMDTDKEYKVRERIETFIYPYYRDEVKPNYRPSQYRLSYLGKIIDLLKKNGDVFLIRMPFEFELYELTNSIAPDFDSNMQSIAKKHGVRYISFWDNPSNYKTTDGVHLYKIEAEKISRDICDSIKTYISSTNK